MLLHPRRFVLENADRVAALEQLVRLGVVQWEFVGVEVFAVAQLHVFDRVLDDRQGLQAQEIHLQQASVFRHCVVELRARHRAVLGGRDRHEVGDVVWGDDDPAGVDARIPHAALQDPRRL